MFTVQGYVDGVSYAVEIDPTADEDDVVNGSPSAIGVLHAYEGEPLLVTPTGPTVIASVTDPAGILASLRAFTEVTSVEGDAPDLEAGARQTVAGEGAGDA